MKRYITKNILLSWKRAGLFAALIGALLVFASSIAFGFSIWLSTLLSILASAVFFGIYGQIVLLKLVELRLLKAERELGAMINIRPLVGPLPLQFGGWAMDATLAEEIAREIANKRPRLVLECGSGSSTLFIASCLERFSPDGHVVSLDHEPKYAENTRELLLQSGKSDRANVVTAPLDKHDVEGHTMPWYSFDPSSLGSERIELLLVDGPPERDSKLARYPAVPLLREYLAEKVTIIIDDGNRDDEREMARRWASQLGGNLRYVNTIKGLWVIRCE